jgi:hypothetical protein
LAKKKETDEQTAATEKEDQDAQDQGGVRSGGTASFKNVKRLRIELLALLLPKIRDYFDIITCTREEVKITLRAYETSKSVPQRKGEEEEGTLIYDDIEDILIPGDVQVVLRDTTKPLNKLKSYNTRFNPTPKADPSLMKVKSLFPTVSKWY